VALTFLWLMLAINFLEVPPRFRVAGALSPSGLASARNSGWCGPAEPPGQPGTGRRIPGAHDHDRDIHEQQLTGQPPRPAGTAGFDVLPFDRAKPAGPCLAILRLRTALPGVAPLAEAGTAPPALTLASPVHAISEVSGDITGRSQLRLADGRHASALDIQREYLARAADFTSGRGADTDSTRVLGLWQRALDAIGAGNLDTIAREIDWVIKYQLIERYRAEHDLPMSAPQVAQADLAYHDINRSRSLYYQLQRDGAVERTARDIDIFEAKTVPPSAGRYWQAG
jgi:hypothetical protein